MTDKGVVLCGKYVKLKLSGRYGIVNRSFLLDTIFGQQLYFWISLNSGSLTVANLDEFEIIY